MTILTWCEECGEDMHVCGGGTCDICGEELCWDCMKEHMSTHEDEECKKIILDGTFECPGCGFYEKHLARCPRR